MSPGDTFRCPHCGQQHPAGTQYCPIKGLPIELGDTAPSLLELPARTGLNRWWIIGGAAVIGIILCLAAFVTLSVLSGRTRPDITPTLLVIQPSQVGATPAPGITLVTATPQPVQTAAFEPWQACADGAYLSHIRVGDTVTVSSNPPLANRVRREPATDAEIVGYLQPGEQALVLDGPGCNNGWVWWKVRSAASSVEGWTAEGDSSNYWLIPVTP
jgi:hypothetical protein